MYEALDSKAVYCSKALLLARLYCLHGFIVPYDFSNGKSRFSRLHKKKLCRSLVANTTSPQSIDDLALRAVTFVTRERSSHSGSPAPYVERTAGVAQATNRAPVQASASETGSPMSWSSPPTTMESLAL